MNREYSNYSPKELRELFLMCDQDYEPFRLSKSKDEGCKRR